MGRLLAALVVGCASASYAAPLSFAEQRRLWEDKSIDKKDASSVGIVRGAAACLSSDVFFMGCP